GDEVVPRELLDAGLALSFLDAARPHRQLHVKPGAPAPRRGESPSRLVRKEGREKRPEGREVHSLSPYLHRPLAGAQRGSGQRHVAPAVPGDEPDFQRRRAFRSKEKGALEVPRALFDSEASPAYPDAQPLALRLQG